MPFLINKYVLYFVIGTVVLAAVSGYVWMWKTSIEEQAQFRFNSKQLEQTIKDKDEEIRKLKMIQENQDKIILDMDEKNENLQDELRKLEGYLASPEADKDDRSSSEILKRTIKDLSGQN